MMMKKKKKTKKEKTKNNKKKEEEEEHLLTFLAHQSQGDAKQPFRRYLRLLPWRCCSRGLDRCRGRGDDWTMLCCGPHLFAFGFAFHRGWAGRALAFALGGFTCFLRLQRFSCELSWVEHTWQIHASLWMNITKQPHIDTMITKQNVKCSSKGKDWRW